MPPNVGTRSRQNTAQERADSRSVNNSFTRDLGMTKLVTGSFTFVNSSTNQIQGANGSFTNFGVNDRIEVTVAA